MASNDNGYRAFIGFRYLVSLLIMLPATFCAGMTLPLITRILMKSGGERAIGQVEFARLWRDKVFEDAEDENTYAHAF